MTNAGSDVDEIANEIQLCGKRAEKATKLIAGDTQRTIEKAKNSCLESKQTTNTGPGYFTLYSTGKICTQLV